MKLDGQVAIVVGSARGIGETIANTFAQEGASIVLVDLEKMKPQLDGVVQEITRKGGSAIAVVADCTDDRQVEPEARNDDAVDRDVELEHDDAVGGVVRDRGVEVEQRAAAVPGERLFGGRDLDLSGGYANRDDSASLPAALVHVQSMFAARR